MLHLMHTLDAEMLKHIGFISKRSKREREQSICLDKTNTKPKYDRTSIWHTLALPAVNSILFDSISTVFQTSTLYTKQTSYLVTTEDTGIKQHL